MRSRVLEPEEWPRLDTPGLPLLLTCGLPEDVDVVAVEKGSEIVGSLAILRVVHFEGLRIAPAHRNAGVARSLLREAMNVASKWSPGWAIGGAADDTMRGFLKRLGGVRMEMDSYALSLQGR